MLTCENILFGIHFSLRDWMPKLAPITHVLHVLNHPILSPILIGLQQNNSLTSQSMLPGSVSQMLFLRRGKQSLEKVSAHIG